MNNIISKQEFITCITNIAKDRQLLLKLDELFHVGLEEYMSDTTLSLIEVLENMFNDTEHWISWFCWENNFGENGGYYCLDKNGNGEYVENTENLYNFLVKNILI